MISQSYIFGHIRKLILDISTIMKPYTEVCRQTSWAYAMLMKAQCHPDESTMPSWWKHNTILMKAQCHAGIRLLDLWCHDGTILVWQRACLREVSRWHQLWWQWKIIKMVPAWYQLYQEIQRQQCTMLAWNSDKGSNSYITLFMD